MTSHPYMPFYVGAYRKKTNRLTTEQHGAYLLLIMELWVQGGEMALDHKELARVAGVSIRRWPKVWEKIGSFFLFGAGFIRHERVDEELQKADQISTKRRAAGMRGNVIKSLKAKGSTLVEASQMRSQMGTQTGTHPDQTIKNQTALSERVAVDKAPHLSIITSADRQKG